MKLRTRAAIAVACFALALAFFAGTAVAGTVHGHAVQKKYAPNGGLLETREVAFKITVDGGDYAMELVPTNAVSADAPASSSYWTRTNGVLHRSEIFPSDTTLGRRVYCSGYLYDEVMPLAGTDCAPLLWMVYAWNRPAGNPEPARLRPVWQADYERVWRSGITFPARLDFSREFSDRPAGVTFMNDGKVRFLDIDGKPSIRYAPAPFNRGYINATVQMDLAPLAPGISVPGGAKYRRYSPNLGRATSTNDVWLVESVDIVTLQSSAQSDPITLPKLLPVAALHDCRAMREMPDFLPMYQVICNGQWTYPNPRIIDLLRSEYLKSNPPQGPVAQYVSPEKSRTAPAAGALALSAATGGLMMMVRPWLWK